MVDVDVWTLTSGRERIVYMQREFEALSRATSVSEISWINPMSSRRCAMDAVGLEARSWRALSSCASSSFRADESTSSDERAGADERVGADDRVGADERVDADERAATGAW